jgi:anthranilate synthase component 2
MKRILVLDNYDSFTYNLVHYVREGGDFHVEVIRNDELSVEDAGLYDGIILSPGPGLPSESGLLLPIIDEYKESKRIFGVCLGLQAITEIFGGSLLNISRVYHGVATPIHLCNPVHYLFDGLEETFMAGRYHSWIANRDNFPDCLRIAALDDEGSIMAISHKTLDICGVQFHPESILTPGGKTMINNWLKGFD